MKLQGQLAVTTSSSKKRKVSRPSRNSDEQARRAYVSDQRNTALLQDTVLPTTEEDIEPASFSFTTSTVGSGLATPTYVRSDSVPAASGLPPRLLHQGLYTSHQSSDYTSSAASSPCAASADLSGDNDRIDEFLPDPSSSLHPPGSRVARSPSPLISVPQHRMIMGGAIDAPQRSSSPLKRRASSMDQDMDSDSKEDVDMINPPPLEESGEEGDKGESRGRQSADQPGSPKSFTMKTGVPPLAEQIKTLETLLKAFDDQPLQEGDKAYLVSRGPLNWARPYSDEEKHTKEDVGEAPEGPVDNSDIIHSIIKDIDGNDFVRLKPGMGLEHYVLFSQDAWDLLMSWYGLTEGQLPIVRYAHNTSPDNTMPHMQFEIHPPVFTIHRLWSPVSPIPIDQKLKATSPPPVQVACSTSYRQQEFLSKIKQLAGVDRDRKVRVWRVTRQPDTKTAAAPSQPPASPAQGVTLTPPDSPKAATDERDPWDNLLVEASRLNALTKGTEREDLDIKDQTNNPNYNGKSTLAYLSMQADDTLVLDENVEAHYHVSNYKGTVATKEKSNSSKGSSSNLTVAPNSANASGRNSPTPGPSTRGRTKAKSGRTVGCVGLGNLGNTCYMNSALQCVRSVEELTKYFLVGEAEKEINTDNPLAHNGDVAMVYYKLLKDIYQVNAPPSISPRQFKNTIGRYAPAFSGYGQQDSQEFVGFLLDGLQEDLSRVKKKPYIEKPDSTDDMINNPQAIKEMADKVWDITKKRDDSVIADLFTGMYKSTLVCPICHKISITFDPFNNLTLPLPMQNLWNKSIKYVPLNDAPVELHVELDKNSSIRSLRDYIAARVGVPAERLIGAEEFKDKFFTIYEDGDSVSEKITSNDVPVFFELEAAPTNAGYRPPKPKHQKIRSMLHVGSDEEEEDLTSEWDHPAAERLAVPVLHRLNPATNRRRGGATITPPHFIIVTREEARSEDAIKRKILEKVASYSTWPHFSKLDDADAADNTDMEMITAPASDADSSGDSKVIAKSVEGEDDMVDISTATGAASKRQPTQGAAPSREPRPLKIFNSRRPKWVNPNEYLPPDFQNLFDLSYFSDPDAGIPSGWQAVSDNPLPSLASRMPPQSVDEEMRSPSAAGNDSSSEESAKARAQPSIDTAELTRMADESSEEEESTAQVLAKKRLSQPQKVGGRRQNRKGQRTYGKKGKKLPRKQANGSANNTAVTNNFDTLVDDSATSASSSGPLIRLGEGIVVDWNEDAWEQVYGSTRANDGRGEPTFNAIETVHDPALAERKKQRAQRRKNGISLDDCLDEFEKQEVLSEQDTWYCPRCKEHVRASKKFDLWKTPDILVVHLKRFSSSGWRRDKLDILVDFPIEGLDLSRRVIDQQTGKEEVFDLIGIDDHWGGLGGGHYTAFAKNFIDGEWYEYNDSSVSKQTNLARMVTSSAYLLFYRRRSEIPLGGPRFARIFDTYESNMENSDEDNSDSGEGQRLGTGSSLRGSSSALIGAEATHLPGSRGLAGPSAPLLSAAEEDETLPTYENAVLGDETFIRGSIEDEGLGGMEGPVQPWSAGVWDFKNIDGDRPGSPATDEAEMNSSNGVGGYSSDRNNTGINSPFEFETPNAARTALPDDEGFGHEDDILPELEDIEAQKTLPGIKELSWNNQQQQLHTIPPTALGDGDALSEKAVDIHVDDDKGGKAE
ncbi:hypothetical protein MCOR25_010065 [Pyricularia grisea]|nr:hypothetical protein MCOR25_010065 [Pyricularia grisea]